MHQNILLNYHIVGIILFSKNLKDVDKIRRPFWQIATIPQTHRIGLLIGTDNDGDNVLPAVRRLQRVADNMELRAPYEGYCESVIPYLHGKSRAKSWRRNYAALVFTLIVRQ